MIFLRLSTLLETSDMTATQRIPHRNEKSTKMIRDFPNEPLPTTRQQISQSPATQSAGADGGGVFGEGWEEIVSRKAAREIEVNMPVDLLTPTLFAAVLILAPTVATLGGGARWWVVVDLAKFSLLAGWLFFFEEPTLHFWAERRENEFFWVYLAWLAFLPSLAAIILLLYLRRSPVGEQ
jgi:hypothetical protein